MNDPVDDGTYPGYRWLAYKIIERAVRDVRLAYPPPDCYIPPLDFLTSPAAQDFAIGWDINLEWVVQKVVGNGR